MLRAADRGVTATALPGIFVTDAGKTLSLDGFYIYNHKNWWYSM